MSSANCSTDVNRRSRSFLSAISTILSTSPARRRRSWAGWPSRTLLTSSGVTVAGSGLFTGSAGMRITNGGGAISAPSGVGLSVTNATIGAAGLTFSSISSANAAKGIELNNTGSLAGLTVTGSGSAGSGGTIQNISARGASFINAAGPLFMLLCSWILERDSATPRQIAGMLISFLGIVVIVCRGDPARLVRRVDRNLQSFSGQARADQGAVVLVGDQRADVQVFAKARRHQIRQDGGRCVLFPPGAVFLGD